MVGFQAEQNRREEAELSLESVSREKQRLQTWMESSARRVEELERLLEGTKSQLEKSTEEASTIPALQARLDEAISKNDSLEKDSLSAAKDMSKLKEIIEV